MMSFKALTGPSFETNAASSKPASEAERDGGRRLHARHYQVILATSDRLYLQGRNEILRGLGLFDLERANIEAGQGWAAEQADSDEAAAELCITYPDSGVHVLDLRQHPHERIRWLEAMLTAARRLRRRDAEGRALGNPGLAYADLGEIRRAIEFYEQQLVIAREIGDRGCAIEKARLREPKPEPRGCVGLTPGTVEMTARDGSEWSHDATIAAPPAVPIVQASAPKNALADTRISAPVKSSKQEAKPRPEAKPKKARMPKERRQARPPNVAGYTWRKDGAGWEIRKSIYVETDTGIRKRRLPYVAHLSKSAFGELKRQHQGAALEKAIAQWIAEHDR